MTRERPLLDAHLRALKLPAVLAQYQRLARDVRDPVDLLDQLVALEVERRHENGISARIAAAHFPTLKTFEAFDFAHVPALPKTKILELADAAFVENKRNVVFYGDPGTGKTHLLCALGVAACMRGHRVLFRTAAGLLMELLDAKRGGTLTHKLRSFDRYRLLLIDELGYVPFEREATDLLFQVISQRYERASLAITTNLAFEQWTQVFPDAMTAAAVIDRIVHHGAVYHFTGTSYRVRERKAKGKSSSTS